MDIETGKVYGHVVASGVFGDAYVVPFDEVLQDIGTRLSTSRVSLPSEIDTIVYRVWKGRTTTNNRVTRPIYVYDRGFEMTDGKNDNNSPSLTPKLFQDGRFGSYHVSHEMENTHEERYLRDQVLANLKLIQRSSRAVATPKGPISTYNQQTNYAENFENGYSTIRPLPATSTIHVHNRSKPKEKGSGIGPAGLPRKDRRGYQQRLAGLFVWFLKDKEMRCG